MYVHTWICVHCTPQIVFTRSSESLDLMLDSSQGRWERSEVPKPPKQSKMPKPGCHGSFFCKPTLLWKDLEVTWVDMRLFSTCFRSGRPECQVSEVFQANMLGLWTWHLLQAEKKAPWNRRSFILQYNYIYLHWPHIFPNGEAGGELVSRVAWDHQQILFGYPSRRFRWEKPKVLKSWFVELLRPVSMNLRMSLVPATFFASIWLSLRCGRACRKIHQYFFGSPVMLSLVCQKTYRNMKIAEQSWDQWDAIFASSLVPLGSLKTHDFFAEKSLTLRHEPQRNGSWKLTNKNSSDGTKHQTRGRSWGAPVKPASQSIRRFIFVEINCCDCWYYISFLCISYIVNMTSCIVFCSFLCSHPFYSGFYRCFSRSFSSSSSSSSCCCCCCCCCPTPEVLAWKVASSDSWMPSKPWNQNASHQRDCYEPSLAIGMLGVGSIPCHYHWAQAARFRESNHFYGTTAFGEFELKCWGVQRSSAAGPQFLCHKWFLKAKPTMTGLHTSCSSCKMDSSHTGRIPISQEFPAKINHSWGMLRFTKKIYVFCCKLQRCKDLLHRTEYLTTILSATSEVEDGSWRVVKSPETWALPGQLAWNWFQSYIKSGSIVTSQRIKWWNRLIENLR